MQSKLKIYSASKPNLGSTELEIYDVAAGVKSHNTSWYTELQGDFAKLSECLQSQGYQCSEATFIKD
jgi:hypothetical protein